MMKSKKVKADMWDDSVRPVCNKLSALLSSGLWNRLGREMRWLVDDIVDDQILAHIHGQTENEENEAA